jgi:hypothetical protein
MSFSHCLGRAKESVQVRGALKHFVTIKKFYGEGLTPTPNPQAGGTTHCRLSATAYSIYSQLPSVHGELPSIRNLRTRYVVVTRDLPNMDSRVIKKSNRRVQPRSRNRSFIGLISWPEEEKSFEHTRVYPKVSGLATWSENCKWYSPLPLDAVVSLFRESV